MSFTIAQLSAALHAHGAPAHLWRWKDDTYDGLSAPWVRDAWVAWVQSLPEIRTVMMQIGGGKTERRPRWVPNIYDCDNHSLSFTDFVVNCCVDDCLTTGRTRGGTALGSIDYTARSSRRVGRHAAIWFSDHEGQIHFFEPADGVEVVLTPAERASITEGFAA